jgi:hypothetical protein
MLPHLLFVAVLVLSVYSQLMMKSRALAIRMTPTGWRWPARGSRIVVGRGVDFPRRRA